MHYKVEIPSYCYCNILPFRPTLIKLNNFLNNNLGGLKFYWCHL